jgi:large subunit ribosomal protein L25
MGFDTSLSLEAKPRAERGKNAARRLRRAGLIPVTVYGHGETAAGAVATRELAAILRAHGRNAIMTLDLDGASSPVKIADLQVDPLRGGLLHADLMRISLTEKTEFEVPVRIVGEADGVRNFGGVLDLPTHSLRIRCLPGDLPESLEVDVSPLGIGAHFRVSDLQIDRDKIEVLADPEVMLATVVPPRVEEEPTPAAAAAEGPAEPEVIKKGKAEEEES